MTPEDRERMRANARAALERAETLNGMGGSPEYSSEERPYPDEILGLLADLESAELTRDTAASEAGHWRKRLEEASAGANGGQTGPPPTYQPAGQIWQTGEYTYVDPHGTVWHGTSGEMQSQAFRDAVVRAAAHVAPPTHGRPHEQHRPTAGTSRKAHGEHAGN